MQRLSMLLLGAIALSTSPADGQKSTPAPAKLPAVAGAVDFVKDIQPILKSRCYRCHGPKKAEGGLRLDLKARALSGGDGGPVIVPGKSEQSRLIALVAGNKKDEIMPPSGPRLPAGEIALLHAWIDRGAVWPDQAAGRAVSDHWAFQPISRPALPTVNNKAWPKNPVDHFMLARLEKEGISPSPEADRITLIRRLSLDLLGLPPTPAQVDEFLADRRSDAYDQLVERLLASKHYGERWARHWLDVARYADSDGYNFDGPRSIWKYRDWVIDAINKDLPFDQFIIQQMAGDLLPGATVEQKTATGFHRNTLFNAEGGNDPEEFRVERVVDRVGTTATAFLGLTMGCAECHAHKYDPFSQRDFYQLYAFFNNAEETTLETPTPAQQAARQKHKVRLKELQDHLERHDNQNNATPAQVARWCWLQTSPISIIPAAHLTWINATMMHADPVRQRLDAEVKQFEKKAPPMTTTLALSDAAKPRTTRIHTRGDFRRPGATVQPDVPEVLPALSSGSRTRLDLAKWLTMPSNPLTARVTVNRVWQHYFGLGLVETENDFGKQGSPPTHPELLDWLASEFMARGWSLKELHRVIVRSATYRQSSRQRPELVSRDARNLLLARQNRLRLDGEIVRDGMLASSGLLSRKVGGPSVFPYQPSGIMELRRSPRPWVVSAGEDRHRRTMYTHYWRTSPHPFLTTFDAPKTDAACTRRHRSNTPLQALMLLNDPAFIECARALADRVLKEATDDDARVQHAFRLCFARAPAMEEQQVLKRLLDEQIAEFAADPSAARRLAGTAQKAAWTAVARVLLNLDEFITRE